MPAAPSSSIARPFPPRRRTALLLWLYGLAWHLLLPVFLLWVLHRMEPEAMAQLWTTQLGWGVLAAVIVMEFVGVLLIRRQLLMRRACRVDNQALRIPDVCKQREERDAVNELSARCCGLFIGARQLKAYQRTVLNIAAAVLAMVAVRNGMAWMRFQTRKRNRLDLWMLRQILGNRKRIAGVAL